MKLNRLEFLLFTEPVNSPHRPNIDIYTKKITGAIRRAEIGLLGNTPNNSTFYICKSGHYKGFHNCSCGAYSSNYDLLLRTKEDVTIKLFQDKNSFFSQDNDNATDIKAVITNSLCIHYVACHRDEIDPQELKRILLLEGEEIEPTPEEIQYNVNVEEEMQFKRFLRFCRTH